MEKLVEEQMQFQIPEPVSPLAMCKDMKKAGVQHPESHDGIKFCLDRCPYDRCIVFEQEKGLRKYNKLEYKGRLVSIKSLLKSGITVENIAEETGLSRTTIQRIKAMYVGVKHRQKELVNEKTD